MLIQHTHSIETLVAFNRILSDFSNLSEESDFYFRILKEFLLLCHILRVDSSAAVDKSDVILILDPLDVMPLFDPFLSLGQHMKSSLHS